MHSSDSTAESAASREINSNIVSLLHEQSSRKLTLLGPLVYESHIHLEGSGTSQREGLNVTSEFN